MVLDMAIVNRPCKKAGSGAERDVRLSVGEGERSSSFLLCSYGC